MCHYKDITSATEKELKSGLSLYKASAIYTSNSPTVFSLNTALSINAI